MITERTKTTYKGMAFASLEGELLVVHGLSVELRQGIGRAAKRGVHGPIDLVKACGDRLPLLPHV